MYLNRCSKLWLTILSAILIICTNNVQAQQTNIFNSSDLSQVKVNQISDADLLRYYDRAVSAGVSEDNLFEALKDKGMPLPEIQKLKLRISSLSNLNQVRDNSGNTNLEENRKNESRYDSSYQYIPLQKVQNDKNIFGSELFSSSSMVFEPNLRIPAPANYMLGPGDEIVVSVYGYSEKKYNLSVDQQGEIYIPNVGPLMLSGLTLEQATQTIKSKLASTIYKAINSGQTRVQITLGMIRSIRVTVIGQAQKPGTYTVSSLTTLYNLLYLCGGPTDMGSYRDIEVLKGNITRTADLYDFLVYGNQKDNILLQEGDVVRIPYYTNRVTLTGNVKRQGKFELLNGETFEDLLKYSGGFTDVAYRGAVSVERITDSVRKIIDLPKADFKLFEIRGSDKYIVGKLQEEFGNRIYISGSVQRPGPYELTPGLTIENLIQKAGGLTVDAYKDRALIYRYLPNKLPAIESVNLDSVFNGKTVYLQKNDSLVIHSIFRFHDENYVSVQGMVRNPGKLQWRRNLTLRDVIFASGGISEVGDSSTVEISRRILNVNTRLPNHEESKIIPVDLFSERDVDIAIEPYDIVIVKAKSGYVEQRVVYVKGEVNSPGAYTLERSKSNIFDIILRTGGFKASADSNSISIRRIEKSNFTLEERTRLLERLLNVDEDSLSRNPGLRNELNKNYELISANLKQIMKDPESTSNLILEDGDVLTVFRNSNLVKVGGEVYFPTVVPFQKNKSLKYYVQQAGNFMPQARKNGALVIQPDGNVKSVKHFLFFKFYPDVTPRSEIFVPRKERDNRTKISTGEWALIVSALGIVANVILNSR